MNIETFDDLMTYLLEEFHVRVWRASCKVEAISGNNSSNVSRDPEIMILSPGRGGVKGDFLMMGRCLRCEGDDHDGRNAEGDKKMLKMRSHKAK